MKVSLISRRILNGFSMTFLSEGEISTPGWSNLPEVRGAWPNKKDLKFSKLICTDILYSLPHFCGSGSALGMRIRIWICIGNADPNPGARKLTKIYK